MFTYRPRVYFASVSENSDQDHINHTSEAKLRRAAQYGFDHVLLDERIHQADQLQQLIGLSNQFGMKTVVRLSIDLVSIESRILVEHPEWQSRKLWQDLPDPRRPISPNQHRALDFDTAKTAEAMLSWWTTELVSMAEKGVNAFCLALDGPAPANFFTRLIKAVKAQSPESRFLAWTPGVLAPRVISLQTCGFDAVFSSSAWWNFSDSWLQEENARLRAFAAVVALVSPPSSADPAEEAFSDATTAFDVRPLWLAAMTADGLMVSDDYLDLAEKTVNASSEGGNAVEALKAALLVCRNKHSGHGRQRWELASAPLAPVAVICAGSSSPDSDMHFVFVANAGEKQVEADIAGIASRCDGLTLAGCEWPRGQAPGVGDRITLKTGEARVYKAQRFSAAASAPKEPKRAAENSAKAPRIVIEGISPCVDGGRFIAKRCVGDALSIEADVFGEGHDRIAAVARWRAVDEPDWQETPLVNQGNDRWAGKLILSRLGRYHFHIEAWIDVFGAYQDEIDKKTAAGQQVSLEIREGRALVQSALAHSETEGRHQLVVGLKRMLKTLDEERTEAGKVSHLLSPQLLQLMAKADPRAFKVRSTPVLHVEAERRAAGFSSWYELFPRSMGQDASTHGTFGDVTARLPAIRDMGFDTLYFPPIHPIGLKHRKGRNNTLDAGPDDLGSPYAIGSPEGGHDAIHPKLGTLEDFRNLRQAALAHGMELALDFAIQCAPDHPWLKEHPDWFTWRPDGSIRYAENPPKKYQDIVNVDFYAKGAVPGLWLALREVVLFWVKEEVKVFRVDNPHTKPMPFWEWLIGDIRGRYPDVIFLAEAFTRPKPMYQLAKLGFSQSYTYFTWRHTKQEFVEYLTELADGPPRDFFRPHFFVNTPDINPYFLQRSGRSGFVIRAALAATLSGLWGMYSGFELCEAAPVPGKEEYLDSEKYEARQRDWNQPGNIIAEITLLNRLRRANPALQSHLGVRFCKSSGDGILCFTKTAVMPEGGGSNVLFIAICLDPNTAQECDLELPLEDWELDEGASVACEDLVSDTSFMLQGRHHRLSLDPHRLAFSVWRLRLEGVM